MNPYVALAKLAVESYIKEGKIIDALREFSTERSGVFVTIKKEKELRGCIGTYLPTKENIAKEIIFNAIAAATEDYRFGLIQEKELSFLSYTVYLLSEPKLVLKKEVSDPPKFFFEKLRRAKLDPKKYGIIVKTGPRTGLLLPDLEDVDTIEKQISIACQKGGIDFDIENLTVYRFTARKYS